MAAATAQEKPDAIPRIYRLLVSVVVPKEDSWLLPMPPRGCISSEFPRQMHTCIAFRSPSNASQRLCSAAPWAPLLRGPLFPSSPSTNNVPCSGVPSCCGDIRASGQRGSLCPSHEWQCVGKMQGPLSRLGPTCGARHLLQ